MQRLTALLGTALILVMAAACSDNNAPNATPTAQPEVPTGSSPTSSSAGNTPAAGTRPASPTSVPQPTVAPAVAATPSCSTAITPSQTEGPYFKAGTPTRTSLVEPGMAGTKLTLSGFVVTKSCKPVANATLEFWQADASGAYDTTGYRLRGHLNTDAQGAFKLETIVPGEYPGRTEHIHFKVIVSGQPTLTSQFYFPDATRNTSDGIFNAKLLLNVKEAAGALAATYTIILDMP